MRDIIRMIIVLAVLGGVSGGLLAAVKQGTAKQIELQQLTFVKGPAIKEVLKEASNDPLVDRFKIKDGDVERDFFVGVHNGKPDVIVFETYGSGFKGNIGIMEAVNLETDKIVAIGVTTHSETPGIGARAKTDETFKSSFKGISVDETCKIKTDGGQVDAVSGATITSKGVCAGITAGSEIYKRLKPQIIEQAKAFAK